MATIELERPSQKWEDRLREYHLHIDGEPIGEIRCGETKTFEVADGRHEASMHIDWCRSQSIELDLQPGETVRLRCSGRSPARSLWYITFGRKRYIRFQRA